MAPQKDRAATSRSAMTATSSKAAAAKTPPVERVSLAPCHFGPGFFSEKQNHGGGGGEAEDEECVCLCACACAYLRRVRFGRGGLACVS